MKNNRLIKELFISSNKLKRLLDKRHLENGLYVGQARVLSYIYRNKDKIIYQKDIEKEFQIRGGSVTGIIDGLVLQNYLLRNESKIDKRKKEISLTNKGEMQAIKALEITNEVEESFNIMLGDKDTKLLKNVIDKIDKWIDEEESNEKII
ncbi:MarR family winged helix-turn-helix transcriptional regulator [Haploplasma modicum]|uniref:MarR family winged helix-turn-helix transcriptional regulator n=1 Tax=Haploplasma modicum TaxID=2150 RepID=UPI00047DCB73|nr:MarR family winged helix-turn-helix transcriptional regulator [Haploplasma modicum]